MLMKWIGLSKALMASFILASLIFLTIFTNQLNAKVFTAAEWLDKYKRDCSDVKQNYTHIHEDMVCKQKLDAALMRGLKSGVIDQIERAGLPTWLSTIPIVESSYDTFARSKAGACGPWQVMPANAVMYFGGRLSLISRLTKSSNKIACIMLYDANIGAEVAIWLLKKLHAKYKRWDYALMAYNAGEPRIDNWIKGEGKALSDETLNYYNQILAIQLYLEEII